jgi:Ankyrin repeat.
MLSWSTFCVCKQDVIVFQLEVLELLVHHGADLNAKTKHDETPAGELLISQSHSGSMLYI